jgi:hypothetical protein
MVTSMGNTYKTRAATLQNKAGIVVDLLAIPIPPGTVIPQIAALATALDTAVDAGTIGPEAQVAGNTLAQAPGTQTVDEPDPGDDPALSLPTGKEF